MATNPSAAHNTCSFRAEAPIFVPHKAGEPIGFKLNPAAAEYKPSKDEQALDQLFSILKDNSISERSEHADGSAESSGQPVEASGSATSSPGRTYAASSSSGTLFGDTVDASPRPVVVNGSEGSSRETSPRRGVVHHHHIHHHPRRRHADRREVDVHHAEFVGSVLHIEHARHADHAQPGHPQHVHPISSGFMHVQPDNTTQHVSYRPYPAAGTLVPNCRPISCEAYLLDHPLRDPRTGYWEVPKAKPIRHRYTEADLALFRSTHKDYKIEHGIPLYAATNRSQTNGNSAGNQAPQASFGLEQNLGQTMAREYYVQNNYDYRDRESIQKVYGCAEGFWYGWY